MSLILKTEPVGIDCTIDRFQKLIYNALSTSFNGEWDCYPRIYKTKAKDLRGNEYFKPEYSSGKYGDYKEVLFNDKVSITSFFLVSDEVDVDNGITTTQVDIIFASDLVKALNIKNHREDEEFIVMLTKQFKKTMISTWDLQRIIKGVDNVYQEFERSNVAWSDIQNRNVVRFSFRVNYEIDC
jgi:hypothetical protein